MANRRLFDGNGIHEDCEDTMKRLLEQGTYNPYNSEDCVELTQKAVFINDNSGWKCLIDEKDFIVQGMISRPYDIDRIKDISNNLGNIRTIWNRWKIRQKEKE